MSEHNDNTTRRIPKAENYVDRFALTTSVGVDMDTQESFIIDFQRPHDTIIRSTDEDVSDSMEPQMESTVRMYLTPTSMRELYEELQSFESVLYPETEETTNSESQLDVEE